MKDKQNLSAGKSIRIASQWPARTMLACQCDTLPMPPAANDEQALFAMLRGVNYLIFDPRDPVNKLPLAKSCVNGCRESRDSRPGTRRGNR